MSLEEALDRGLRIAFGPEPVDPGRALRYALQEEIARGGVGIVHRAVDVHLGRDVAVKILQAGQASEPGIVARFLREARIAGRLQHPGIVPIYETGRDAEGRPFIAMKRVAGRTLETLLEGRGSPSDRRAFFLRTFEQVAQAMGYAHAQGVIHRDLKPGNVMVGEFGEVQIVDWGIAKVLSGGSEDPGLALEPTAGMRVSVAGTVMGTPLYMAPEQALGKIDELDARTDVFSLGAILCEILTGAPPATGTDLQDVFRRAGQRDYGDIGERLARCGADPELARLALDCLRPQGERPRDASEVATRMAGILAAVEDRARRAEVEAAEQRVRAAAERRGRRLTLGLAAMALILAAGLAVVLAQRAERRHQAELDLRALLTEAAGWADQEEWARALDILSRADPILRGASLETEASERVVSLRERYTAARQAKEALDRIDRVREEESRPPPDLDRAYRDAFAGAGFDMEKVAPEEIGRRIAALRLARRQALVVALDHWASRIPPGEAGLQGSWERAVRAGAAADSDPWRTDLRRALLARDRDRIRELAAAIRVEPLPPASVLLAGQALARLGFPRREELEILRAGHLHHPGDYWLNLTLGHRALDGGPEGPPDFVLAERHLRLALSGNPGDPDVQGLLGLTLLALARSGGPPAESGFHLRAAARATSDPFLQDLFGAAADAGNPEALRRAIRSAPPLPPHYGALLRKLDSR